MSFATTPCQGWVDRRVHSTDIHNGERAPQGELFVSDPCGRSSGVALTAPPPRRLVLAGLAACVLAACSPAPEQRPAAGSVTVFAAASLTDALTQIASDYEARTGRTIRLSFAASGAVARQVEAGAPADLVILADRPWMDRLEKAGRLAPNSRVDLLNNRLVLIGAADAAVGGDPFAWLKRTGGRLAVGDPESVPAGAYARTWLQAIGRWNELEPRLVTGADVRAVRTFVARGEAALGVVYRSDVIGAPGVRVVLEPPASEQPEIVYPAALTAGATPAGADFLRYLQSPEAQAIFRAQGFSPRP